MSSAGTTDWYLDKICTPIYEMQKILWDVCYTYVRLVELQLVLIISNSLISNTRLSRSDNLVPA